MNDLFPVDKRMAILGEEPENELLGQLHGFQTSNKIRHGIFSPFTNVFERAVVLPLEPIPKLKKTMKKLLTILFATAFGLTLGAQTECSNPPGITKKPLRTMQRGFVFFWK